MAASLPMREFVLQRARRVKVPVARPRLASSPASTNSGAESWSNAEVCITVVVVVASVVLVDVLFVLVLFVLVLVLLLIVFVLLVLLFVLVVFVVRCAKSLPC